MNICKKVFIFIAGLVSFLIMGTGIAFAHGAKDTEEISVTNLESWQETFDLNNKKKGKYNIMVTASDLAGNEQIEGPFNIYVDPKSDLPVCGITNPRNDMRIVGSLDVVGTCIDDDGVGSIELIFDKGTDHELTVAPKGTEFWSYQFTSDDMDKYGFTEGHHTITVTGTDINGLKGNPKTISWNLDKEQPVTEVRNMKMGTLVSKTAKFKGLVSDGNEIALLEYSVDDGKTFMPVKLSSTKKKAVSAFSIIVDTKKYFRDKDGKNIDGSKVLWFRATDKAGSVGVYSFLYVVDNTPPDIEIISPAEKETQYGKFAVLGVAGDDIGLTKLTYTWGNDAPKDLELIPGNPFFGVNLNTIGLHESSRKFTITGTDRAGNIISVSRNIPLNQELDKPVVTITYPMSDTYFETDQMVFVRGIVKDNEGVKSVKYRVDGGEWITEETKGVFCGEIKAAAELSAGRHTVTVVATDKNGVEGNAFTQDFNVRGGLPVFRDAKITGGRGTRNFVDGITVHPEEGASFQVVTESGIGLTSVTSKVTWGKSGTLENSFTPNGNSQVVTIPVNADFPRGAAKITVTATDTAGRSRSFKGILKVTNTAKVTSDEAGIHFDDSVLKDGVIINNKEFPASAYFIGGNARAAEIVPATPFAKAELHGNQIVLVPGTAAGASDPVQVRVTTDQGLQYTSDKIVFKYDPSFPTLKLNSAYDGKSIDGSADAVTITGSASAETGIGRLGYYVYSAKAVIVNGAIASLESMKKSDFNEIKAGRSFSIPFNAVEAGYGIYILEIVAESAGGNKTSDAVCIKNIPPLGSMSNGKPATAKAPMITWADGQDTYSAVVFQGTEELDHEFKIFRRSEMTSGTNSLSDSVTFSGKPVVSKYSAVKVPEVKAYISTAGDKAYMSGMPVELAQSQSGKLVLVIDTEAQVSSVNYEFTGDNVPGGSNQSGTASAVKSADKENRWTAEIPVSGLPVRVSKVKITVKAGSVSKEVIGYISVVRPADSAKTDDSRSVYTMESGDAFYDIANGAYVIKQGNTFNFFANVPSLAGDPVLLTPADGLSLERKDNNVILTVDKPGKFNGVQVRVKDLNGVAYTSSPVNFIVDSNGFESVKIQTPELHQWVKRSVRLTGTAVASTEIKSGEYSMDNGATWNTMALTKAGSGSTWSATWTQSIDLTNAEDGLISIDVRLTDTAGNFGYAHTSVHRDTTPPEVSVIVPTEDRQINGNNLIAFKVYDAGSFEKANYVAPSTAKAAGAKVPVEGADNYTLTHVGTAECPIDPAMSFQFIDDAGNTASIEKWNFTIDNKSDLPVTEIHLPEDNEVITRDFTLSGVILDDDGPCKIFWKLDDGEYHQYFQKDAEGNEIYDDDGNQQELYSSYAIDGSKMFPLWKEDSAEYLRKIALFDNEHTFSVYAVDVNGVKGPVTTRKFRVSLAEPVAALLTPTIDTSVKNVITLTGNASDKNGIEKVTVSLDNGNSFNDAIGTTDWTYTFDTRAIPNGTNVVFIRVFDKYGISGLYSSLINIDNEAPEMILDYPVDYSTTAGPLFFSGYAFDNVEITDMYVSIRSLDGKDVPRSMRKVDFALERIIARTLDLTSLDNGSYNVELTALDKAGNETHVSRNIVLNKSKPLAVVNLLYPLNGEHKNGNFNIYGEVTADKKVEKVTLYVDDKISADTTLAETGYFKFEMKPENLSAGIHRYRVDASVEGGTVIKGRTQTVDYSTTGPWVTVDNFSYGDFAVGRPFVGGKAGYTVSDEDKATLKNKKASKEEKEKIEAKTVEKVEISFNNGKSFEEVSKGAKWKYRIENQDLPEGFHFMLVRATMMNGETAIERVIIQIDNTSPTVRLIAPDAGGHYNQELLFSGLSGDDIGLKDVKLGLRKGDKASYEVPSFIQGLYVDASFWGATLYSVGMGLTFFDDNVKIQAQWGQFTQDQRTMFSNSSMRYGGDNIFGLKILANVAQIPFSYFFGRDYEWLSSSVAVGANFTRFNESASGKAQILSALVGQVEFPKVTFPQMKMFSSFSLYSEISVWFIPSDVTGDSSIKNIVPQFSEGIRLNVF